MGGLVRESLSHWSIFLLSLQLSLCDWSIGIQTMISEGLVRVRETNRATDEQVEYKNLSEEARTQQKGIHNEVNKTFHVRNVTWNVENPRHFVDAHHQKPIPGLCASTRTLLLLFCVCVCVFVCVYVCVCV